MKTQLLRQLIREEIKNQITPDEENQISSTVKTISKALDNQKSNFSLITTQKNFTDLMDKIFSKLDSDFKESLAFKQGIRDIHKKYHTQRK